MVLFFFQAEDGIRDYKVMEFRRVLFRSFLGRRQPAPARRLVEQGVAVALATDFNPGSSPAVSLPLVAALGVSQLGLRHTEAMTAVTVKAAAALGLAGGRGQIAGGFAADPVVWGRSDLRGAGEPGGAPTWTAPSGG